MTFLLLYSLETQESKAHDVWDKKARAMISELEKEGTLQSIIDQGCKEVQKLPSDFGRGGKRGMAAFQKVAETKSEGEVSSFKTSLDMLLSSPEELTEALQEELVRRFSELQWKRSGKKHAPSTTTITNRINFVTGEILRRFKDSELN